VILWITISVTFFPAFVTMAQGLLLVPRAALDVPRAYGASLFTQLRLVGAGLAAHPVRRNPAPRCSARCCATIADGCHSASAPGSA